MKPRQIKINASHSTPIVIKPGRDKHGFYAEIGVERQHGGKCITPCEAKRLVKWLNRFIEWGSSND